MGRANPVEELEKIFNAKLHSLKYFEPLDFKFNVDNTFGDISTPVALRIGKIRKLDSMHVAEKIIEGIKLPPYISQVGISKPGFINLTFSDRYLLKFLARPIKLPLKSSFIKERVIVEYSSPNIAKPFGVGHLRSTIIGDAVANLFEALGAKVWRINHIGDWGTQFGKLIYAFKKWGNQEVLEEDPIAEMFNLYVRFHTEAELDPSIEGKARYWFKKLEDGDAEAVSIWKKFSHWSLIEFNRIYQILRIKFDDQNGESSYLQEAKNVIDELKRKKLAEESEGVLVVKFEDEEITPALLVKSDGATTYIARDLAALKKRLVTLKGDVIIYHVGSEQRLHFLQLFEIAQKAGWIRNQKLIYASHGLMRLPEGKMSTRKGRVIALDKILEEAISRAYTVVNDKNPILPKIKKQEIAKAVGIGAVKYNDLQNHRSTEITFEWDKILSFEGNSAPYLQYTYARLKSIFRKAHIRAKISCELNDDEKNIARKLAQFPSVLYNAANTESPNILATYLYELAGALSSYYEKYPIVKSDVKTRRHRMAVVLSGANIIKIGLELLGIQAPEEI